MVTTATDLQAALNRGGNIILGSDIGVEKTLTVAANSNLDLNGYKLSIVTRNNSAIQINIGQTLTIADNKYVSNSNPGNGKLYANGYRAGIQTSGATLIIEGGVVEAKGQWATGIGGIDRTGYSDGGTVIINDGTVSATGGCPGTLGISFKPQPHPLGHRVFSTSDYVYLPIFFNGPIQFFLALFLRFCQNIFVNGLARHRVAARRVAALPAAIGALAQAALSVCSFLSRSLSPPGCYHRCCPYTLPSF